MGNPARFELVRSRSAVGLLELRFVPADSRGLLDAAALESLRSAAKSAAADRTVRLVALHGARNDLFAAGADLDDIERTTPERAGPFAEAERGAFEAWKTLEATTVAVVRGACLGAAVDLVLDSDVVLALPGATFAHPGVARDTVDRREGGTARAGRRLSLAALRDLFTGEEPLSLERAVANGLVDLAIEDDVTLSDLLRVWSGPAGESIRSLKRVARSVDTLMPARSFLAEERSNELDES